MGQKIRLNQCLQKQDFQPLQGPLSSSQLVHTMYTYIIISTMYNHNHNSAGSKLSNSVDNSPPAK